MNIKNRITKEDEEVKIVRMKAGKIYYNDEKAPIVFDDTNFIKIGENWYVLEELLEAIKKEDKLW